MATKSTWPLMEETLLYTAMNQPRLICPEGFGAIYKAHYRHVLQVCRELGGIADRSTPSPLSQILRKDERRQVREQLTRLPERYRVPLVLRYYGQMSYSEIARALNTRLPAARMMIFRAKDYLRRNWRRSEEARERRKRSDSTVRASGTETITDEL